MPIEVLKKFFGVKTDPLLHPCLPLGNIVYCTHYTTALPGRLLTNKNKRDSFLLLLKENQNSTSQGKMLELLSSRNRHMYSNLSRRNDAYCTHILCFSVKSQFVRSFFGSFNPSLNFKAHRTLITFIMLCFYVR